MNAIIISVGTELTSGQTLDTNSAFLARQLAACGIPVCEHITVGDEQAAITAVIGHAAQRAELVIVTGGLGPTEDDLTRAALADALGCTLAMDERSLAEITEFFRIRNRPMGPANRTQALVPTAGQAIPNKVGTAPGLYAKLGQAEVFVTPGVPSEMEWMFHNAIAPRLRRQNGVILHRIMHTFGMGESDVGAKIADLMRRGANPLVGTTVAAGMVSIRIIAHADAPEQASTMADDMAAQVEDRLGEIVIGRGEITMASAVGQLLLKHKQTLATAESCTGGLVGKMITDSPGSSDYYIGGVVSYSNAIKTQLLGVGAGLLAEHGAVSEPVARAMAEGCRNRLSSDWAISVTGIAGPGGGSDAKPVGTVWIGLAGPSGTDAFRTIMPGTREIIRLRAALAAMNALRLKLRYNADHR